MSDFIRSTQAGRIVTLTLSRPAQRNALASHDDCAALVSAVQEAAANPDVAVLVLTGEGPAFCAGGDLKAMRERDPAKAGIGALSSPLATRNNYRRGIQRIPEVLWDCELPTIAAINGAAIGAGLDLALMCDLRIAAQGAKLASSFVKVGIVPGDGGAYLLPRAVGWAKAAEMMFTGDALSADEALACGLVSRVVEPASLMDEAMALAQRIAANPPQTLRLVKRLLREAQHARLGEVLQLSAAFQALAHETTDHREALDAFIEKRPPVFTGS
ncbi:crotonase/enoyl-CoA hydratase family protein [Aquabacterium sp.]|uniref:crotonase/enoyl-CoA hydratase family protein n=1 Tax=Aquabacterium sp. TaxID=1872578 RepID=UPI002D15FE1E|nr:crotonase/enoyl-CoA hydratase family protein [Aquabacterium sp.]HSW04920.1 crotonase/enoyl-CoA hydratase family protein [Aquabacterium sp.]